MEAMVPEPLPPFSRRSFLAAAAVGLTVLVAGCTSSSSDGGEEAVTPAQADSLAEQVAVQEALVAAYAAAGAADPALQAAVAELATQAAAQLERLQAAAPGAGASSASTTASSAPAVGPDPKAWLREQVAATGRSHAAACVAQIGGRAALLGSIAAGLRGQEVRLA
jgi:hypothetical protein